MKSHVIGHEWAVELLQRQQAAGRVPQALLLAGPASVGKTTLACFFAQSLNCGETTSQPCGTCLSCRKINSGNHPDVRIFDREDEAIKIEIIRELQRELSLSPVEGRFRVVVLSHFERATRSAANALLKTLEEPAPQVVIVLTVTDPGALLPTIVSRCQVVTLRALPAEDIFVSLQTRWQIPEPHARLLAQLASGRPGWAIRAVEDPDMLERREQQVRQLLALLSMNRVDRLAYALALSRDPLELQEVMHLWLTVWRDIMLLRSGSQATITNLDRQVVLQEIVNHVSLAQAAEAVARLRQALLDLERNVNARLSLEVTFLKLPVLAAAGRLLEQS